MTDAGYTLVHLRLVVGDVTVGMDKAQQDAWAAAWLEQPHRCEVDLVEHPDPQFGSSVEADAFWMRNDVLAQVHAGNEGHAQRPPVKDLNDWPFSYRYVYTATSEATTIGSSTTSIT
mmetsp:Transcript_38308/g.66209  ORF Transcript_38308/g.66209 Transcript_38308/m.66209 type:complete len:117 (-) Transcript_38308:94-444(-)